MISISGWPASRANSAEHFLSINLQGKWIPACAVHRCTNWLKALGELSQVSCAIMISTNQVAYRKSYGGF